MLKLILLTFIILLMVFSVGCSNKDLIKKALESKDITFCNKINDKKIQNQCFFELADFVPTACSQINMFCGSIRCDNLIDQCYQKLFEKNPSEEICSAWESKDEPNSNIFECFKKVGYSDVSACKKFSSYRYYKVCIARLSEIENYSLTEEDCKTYASKSDGDSLECYNDLAITIGDIRYCNNNSEGFVDSRCVTEVAKAKKDPETCNAINPFCFRCENGDSCYADQTQREKYGQYDQGCESYLEYCKKVAAQSS
ncbi:MAG: hypothetical protein AABX51_07835 [Nanoarchaeota archaeon]